MVQSARPLNYRTTDAMADAYAARTQLFAEEGRQAGLRPAAKDGRKVALVIVDGQWDFVHPTGTLYVPGSQEDMGRMVEFLYSNVEEISSTYASLDSHVEYQIFYGSWWQYQDDGTNPAPFTIVMLNSANEIVDHNGRRLLPLLDPMWSMQYLRDLKQKAQKDLMIWPEHTMIGTQGHMLMPVLSEALAFHSTARRTQVNFLMKGTCPQVEHYGIFAPEVQYAKHPQGGLNTAVLDAIAAHDLIYVGGEAKSHCVLATMLQLTKYFQNQPDVIRKLRFLMDCTSSVVHPAVDFEALANAALRDMQKLGVQLVKSTDVIG